MSERKDFNYEGHVTLSGEHPEMEAKAKHPYNPSTYGKLGTDSKIIFKEYEPPEVLKVNFPIPALVRVKKNNQEYDKKYFIDLVAQEVYREDHDEGHSPTLVRVPEQLEKVIFECIDRETHIPSDLFSAEEGILDTANNVMDEYNCRKDASNDFLGE